MSLLDSIQNAVHKVLPEKKGIPLASSGGIGNGHAPFEDDVRATLFIFVFSSSRGSPFPCALRRLCMHRTQCRGAVSRRVHRI